jgi:hypothetical protein
LVALALAPATTLLARDLDRFDFSLRFPAAISRFASYADVAALGNAQAASEWSSSNNPASAAWPHASLKYSNSLAPQFTTLRFREGTNLYVFAEALTLNMADYGVLLPAAAQIRSNHERDSDGLGFQFDADYFQLQWGKLLGKGWAVGANFNVTPSDTRFDLDGTRIARSRGESYDFRLGALHQLSRDLRAGLIFDYGFAPARSDLLVLSALGVTSLRTEDTTHQVLLRPGITWEYAKGCTLNLDYQAGVFINSTGTLWVHRFPIGIEHSLIKDILFVRGGVTIDTRGEVPLTTGLGLALSNRASVDVAYQYNMFPEIRREFGSAHTFVVSVGVAF